MTWLGLLAGEMAALRLDYIDDDDGVMVVKVVCGINPNGKKINPFRLITVIFISTSDDNGILKRLKLQLFSQYFSM